MSTTGAVPGQEQRHTEGKDFQVIIDRHVRVNELINCSVSGDELAIQSAGLTREELKTTPR